VGTLHLASHHLIYRYVQPSTSNEPSAPVEYREKWITYPMIAFCTYRQAHPASHQQPSIRLRCRDFTFIAFHFLSEDKARDVYETIRNQTCRLGRLEKLYAFSYQAQGPEKELNSWDIYDAEREFARQGVGAPGDNKGWRITKINETYEVSNVARRKGGNLTISSILQHIQQLL
jgi:myotubularin-related protein 6/7/8